MVLCGYPDLVIKVTYPVLGLEYDGAYHDTPDQRHADNRREDRLALAGLPLLRYGAYSVARQRELIVAEISTMTGLRALSLLDDLHFRRAPQNHSF
jgi:very-short-patch-repair endonuclease